ncbi:MAG: hypothetical protein LAT62_13415 [Natronospirillum sp.]|uniref:hypothetical protein n=1 Tax=Natronospirillum sp. TaxID=2812955 RepID=UPI0025DEE499|nr:hypothetical protein [Natronospirillum sp.]MCH8552932.1 hypothetical protein [Natronospirillum sp.]
MRPNDAKPSDSMDRTRPAPNLYGKCFAIQGSDTVVFRCGKAVDLKDPQNVTEVESAAIDAVGQRIDWTDVDNRECNAGLLYLGTAEVLDGEWHY